MSALRVAVIGLGELGNTLVEDLLNETRHEIRVWDWRFDDPSSSAAAHLATLQAEERIAVADAAGSALIGCHAVFSAVTADQAVACAESVMAGLADGAFYVDVNSISPQAKCLIRDIVAAQNGRFVEASVMSPIFPLRSKAPILLGGDHAQDFLKLAHALPLSNLSVASSQWGVAAATKMCRSVVVKGIEALVTESLLSARHYGVESTVLASLSNLFPRDDWEVYAKYLITRSLQHGERRASEMREAAKTVEEAGVTPWMSLATVDRQAWAPQHQPSDIPESLFDLLDVINSSAIEASQNQIGETQ